MDTIKMQVIGRIAGTKPVSSLPKAKVLIDGRVVVHIRHVSHS